jgi:hypothetical protein
LRKHFCLLDVLKFSLGLRFLSAAFELTFISYNSPNPAYSLSFDFFSQRGVNAAGSAFLSIIADPM